LRAALSPSVISRLLLRARWRLVDVLEPLVRELESDALRALRVSDGGADNLGDPVVAREPGWRQSNTGNICAMSSPDTSAASWVARVDLAFVERRFGAETVNRLLGTAPGRDYAEPPRMESGRLAAALLRDPRDPLPNPRSLDPSATSIALRVRVRDDDLEMACACSRGRPYVCEHVMRVLLDVAVHPRLRDALAAGEEITSALVDALPAFRSDAHEERTLDERLARWLPAAAFDDDLEIDVEPVRSAGLASAEERPALVLRHRRPRSRTLLRPRDVIDARLPPRHRRLVELTAASHTDRDVLVSTRGQASMLLHLLRDESPIFTRSWKSRLRFASAPVVPRLEADATGRRLVARWYTTDGRMVADAADALLFTGAFPYLWSETLELFHPVAPQVDLDVAWGLARVPSLPLSARSAEKIGRALHARGRGLGVALPPPEVFGLPPLEAPSFELTLEGSPLDVRGELFAVYSAGRTRVAPQRAESQGQGRDLEAEAHALARVREAGLGRDPDDDAEDDGLGRATEDRAVHLWQEGLPALLRETDPRVKVVVAESLARVRVGPPVGVHVEVGVASGWLETELDFRAGALKVEMNALRAALSARGRWVALSDGTLARIGDEVSALVDESSGLFDDSGRGRLAPHQLGRLERWIERFGGHADEGVSRLRGRLRSLAVRAEPDLPVQLEATLRPYQLAGVAWLQFLRELGAGGVLADDMGLGKTLMTLAFLARWKEDAGAAPSLVVCPTSVVGNWVSEAQRFTPGLRVLVLHGGSRAAKIGQISDFDLVVTTYAVLRRDIARLAAMRFRCAVLDEAQNVKSATTATARAAQHLVSDMRLALSGTPIENRLAELRAIMSFVNPGMLGTSAEFDERFERPITNDPRGVAAEELRALIRPFVLRRTKADVLLDLPPKTEVERSCVLGLRQKRLYDALALTLREAVRRDIDKRGLARSRLSVLTAILRLRQMACDPRLVDPTVAAADSAKRAVFLEVVRELVAEGRRALVFSQFVALFALWREDLDREEIAYEYLDGSSVGRAAIVERFQSGSAPLFLVSLKAGGAGLNLTAADTVIHCDPWWNPAVEDQATDRAHRMGQERPVTVVRLVASGTIEEKIGALKGKKRELAAAVIAGADAVNDDDARGSVLDGALGGLSDEDVGVLLGGLKATEVESGDEAEKPGDRDVVERRFVAAREVDELRAILRRVENSGTRRSELARKVGLPVARVTLLLIGHAVPIPTRSAAKIRALRP
jgi:superfamily II DNA or RNA helicase